MPVNLTAKEVERIPFAAGRKDLYYYDSELTGFALRVGQQTKTFFAQGYVDKRKIRKTLGHYPAVSVDEARRKAKSFLGQVASGVDPVAAQRKTEAHEAAASVTLRMLFDQHIEARQADGGLRPKTIAVYDSALKRCFGDWLDKPAACITKEMVIERYREIATTEGKRSKKGGAKAQAAQAMRVLRTLLNFGSMNYEDADGKSFLPDNPVKRLKQKHRDWNRVAPKDDVIDPQDLKPWYQAVSKLRHETMRDFLLFCLFTGLRRSAACQLTWDDINPRSRTLTIPESVDKTGKRQRLPLSDFVYELLERRSEARSRVRSLSNPNPYVFPGDKPATHLQEPKTAIAKVVERSGVKFSTHTLRKTFATTAERLDISYYKLKHLLNHAVSGDVTGRHYVQVDVELLRQPMQQIADYLKAQIGIAEDGKREIRQATAE